MRWANGQRAACLVLALGVLAGCVSERGNGAPSPSADKAEERPAAGGADGAGDPYYPTDGNGGYDVTGYHVSISYQPSDKQLDGDTTVTATATDELTVFNLDLVGFEIASVEVDGAEAKVERTGDHEVVITPAKPIAKDATFTTRVRYSGVPEKTTENGLGETGWQISSSGGAFAAGEPHSATSWYPANDTPRDKATFTLDARVPKEWSVISNGVEEPPTPDGDWMTYHWTEPTRVATYLTTIGIDKWTYERSQLPSGVPVVSAYAPGAEGAKTVEARLPEILDFLSTKFGPYPQSAAGGIYINESIGFSLETQGRPIYANWVDLETVIHENAHQWFGNSVSVQSWSDICLNECFASYAPWLWEEAKDGTDLDEKYLATVSHENDGFWKRPLHDMGPGNEFTAVYDKGPLALHALRRQIGDEAFGTVLTGWTAEHRDGNASMADFQEFVEKTAGQDLDGFFEAWFDGQKKPADEFLYPGPLRR
jgi:aminopeptidase N